MKPPPIRLLENGDTVEVPLSSQTGMALMGTGFVDARPVPATNLWAITPQSKVGAICVGDVQVHVAPKIPIARVIFLLEYSRAGVTWRDGEVDVHEADDLLVGIVEAFERLTSRALRQGLLQGYRTVEESLPVVRGRIREADQLRRQFGLPVPIEVRYDDYTADIPENRLLRAAVLAARHLPGLDRGLRHRLQRLDRQLTDVTPVTCRALLEPWRPSRLNARLQNALHLARVIVDGSSFEPGRDGLTVVGFVINMAKVFEDFVCVALGNDLRRIHGRTGTQVSTYLDQGQQVRMRPDLVWYADDGGPRAVVDAKYKAEKPSGFPDADLYQMLAYCTALSLPIGHLVYARGNEHGHTHHVHGTDILLRAHTLDLNRPPTAVLRSVSHLAETISATTCPAAASPVAAAQE